MRLDFHPLSLLDGGMRRAVLGCLLWSLFCLPGLAGAVTSAPALTDREIAERLTRLETRLDEGLTGLRTEMGQLRTEMGQLRTEMGQLRTELQEQTQQLRTEMGQLRTELQEQTQQLRTEMNIRFEEHFRLVLGILAAFAAIVAVNIGLVVWDRRVAVRPFEEAVKSMAEEVAANRSRLSALAELLRAVGQQDERAAAVLKRFNLL